MKEQSLKEHLKDYYGGREPSARVLERLTAGPQGEESAPESSVSRWSRIAPLAVAAGLALLLVGTISWRIMIPLLRADQYVALMIEDHLELAGTTGTLEIRSKNQGEVSQWVQTSLGISIRPPSLPQGVLVGARRCVLSGKPGAYLLYERPGRSGPERFVSLFVFDDLGANFSRMDEFLNSHSKRICHKQARGLSALVWEDRGLTYALVSALPDETLSGLVEAL